MIRVVAYIMRFYKNCKAKANSHRIKSNFLCNEELKDSINVIIKHEQKIYFADEINSLKNGKDLKKSPLNPLHPFLDKDGIIRVGGRLQNASLTYNRKHPIILPKKSCITDMIIRYEHLRLLHAGPRLLLSTLNEKYWLIDGMRHVKKAYS